MIIVNKNLLNEAPLCCKSVITEHLFVLYCSGAIELWSINSSYFRSLTIAYVYFKIQNPMRSTKMLIMVFVNELVS